MTSVVLALDLALGGLDEPDAPEDAEEQPASAIAPALMIPEIRRSLCRREVRFMSRSVHQLFVR
jgi:hypothetical protein